MNSVKQSKKVTLRPWDARRQPISHQKKDGGKKNWPCKFLKIMKQTIQVQHKAA